MTSSRRIRLTPFRWSLGLTSVFACTLFGLMHLYAGDWPWSAAFTFEKWMAPASVCPAFAAAGLMGLLTFRWLVGPLPAREHSRLAAHTSGEFMVLESEGEFRVMRRGADDEPFVTTDADLARLVCDQWSREFGGQNG